MALGGAGFGGGHGEGSGHWRAHHGSHVGPMTQIDTLQHAAYGPGEGGEERSGWGGYMPNGEDGLMTLADFGRDHNWGNPNQGNQPDWDGKPGGPDGVGSDGPHGGGPGGPGGYTGGGGGGGGPGGGPGGGKPGDNGNNGGVGGNGGNGGNGGTGGTPGSGDPGSPWTGDGGHDSGGKPCYWYCEGPPGGDPPGFVPDPGPGGPGGGGSITSAVPEPAAWMMLILGFGALGSVLRAQRRRAGRALA